MKFYTFNPSYYRFCFFGLKTSFLVLVASLLLSTAVNAQVVIYQQNFDGNNGGFSNSILSEITPNNGWLASSTAAQYAGVYRHVWNLSTIGTGSFAPITGRSLGVGLFNGNSPFYASPFQYYNGTSCGLFPNSTTRWAYVPISTVGYTNITVEFKWRSTGETFSGQLFDYGTVNTSIDGGSTWLLDQSQGQGGTDGNGYGTYTGGLYYGNSGVTTTTITLPASRDNQANFALAFRAVIDACYGTGGGFIVDDIIVRGIPTSSCVAGTASPSYQYVPTNGTANMTLTGYSGSTIQWQVSANGTTGWANVSGGLGATTDSYVTGSLADGTYFYRAVVTDGGSCSDNSNVIEVLVAANPSYCSGAGIGNSAFNNHIEDMVFHEWGDPNPGYFTNNYLDYSDTATYGYATVVAGQYHHFAATIRANISASTTVAAWIDFNGDGVFDNTSINSGGELLEIANFSSTVGNTYAAYFPIPVTSSGAMRMRVRALAGNLGTVDPCGNYTNSQTKDLTVLALPAISGGEVCGTVNGNADNVSTNSTVDKVNISRVLVTGPSGTVMDNNSAFFGVQTGGTIIMYNYTNMMGSFSNGLTMEANGNYSINIEHSGYTVVAGVFIDWNGDGDFDDANEIVGRLSDPAANPFIFNFTVPSTVTNGMQAAMRVRLRYDQFASLGNTLAGCNNISDGLGFYSEVEDYRVTFEVPSLTCAPVANLAAAIGTPANGLAHHMDVTWDALSGATGYDIEFSNNGSSWTSLGSVSTNSYDHNFADNPNVAMYYRVRAKDGSQTCNWATMVTPVYTACDNPEIPTTSNSTSNTMDIAIANETPVLNPAITTYSIYESTTGQYVQANGTLGAIEVFQTKAVWGTTTVTGLNASTEYCYVAKARNNDGDERGGAGASLLTLQEFNSSGDLNTTAGSGPTNVWWSPSSCTTGGMTWDGSTGCSGGAVGFSGSFNNFYGCFLRSPATDCNTLNVMEMTFDLSNSFFASQPNDRVYFNMWAPTAGSPGGTYISASMVNGVSTSDLFFTQVRNCEEVVVEFDLSTVTDKSAILFYINADCAYNTGNVYYVWSDNIQLAEQAPKACATTDIPTSSDLVIQSITPDVTNVCSGGTVSYDVVVENAGLQAVPATSFDVAAYQGSLVCGGTATATQSFATGLAPSATTTLTFTLALNGSSDVSFEVDVNNTITEGNEANNCSGNSGVTLASGLGGTYTIDAGQATGGINYASFADAAADLNALGVCGPVIFEVATDVYNENIILTDIVGVSAVNTVTFRSATGVAAQVTLQSSTTDVVVLHNADYFRFENMTIDYTGSSAVSAIELQDDADDLIVDGCILDGSSSTSTSNTNAVIYASESTTSLLIDNMIIRNSTIQNGGNGIYFASGSAESSGIEIDGNTFASNSRRGMYLDDCAAPQVTGNTITSASGANTSYAAIDIDNSSGATRVLSNIIGSDFMRSGIVIDNSDATSGNEALVANNFVFIGGSYNAPRGIDITGSDYVNVYHNTVSMTSSNNSLGYAALYMGSTTIADGTINIVNNIFSVTNGGTSQTGIYLASTNNRVDIGTIDYNNYYATGSASIAYSSGDYTLATWQALLSDDANSLELDPQFTSATDLHVAELGLSAGTGTVGITEDIDGDFRLPTPTMGADEISVPTVANDATPSSLISPIDPCPGSNAFEIEVTNLGTNNLTSFTVNWSVGGVAQTPVNVTGVNVPQFGTTNVVLGNVNLVSNTSYDFVFTTSLPNGVADNNSANDTLTLINQYTALNGTYTIGGVGFDFGNFNTAVAALHAYGVCGPVVFDVREATYTEQVQINTIDGVSAVNTVTFQADPANTNPAILQYNSQAFSDNYVLNIDGSSFLRFRELTINTTSTGSYAGIIAFTQANDDIQFINNIIEAPVSTSNSINRALVYGDDDVAATDDNLLFDGNTLNNGSYGILLDATSSAYEDGPVITNNEIIGFNAFGINLQYQTNATIEGNTIRNGVATANATGVDLFYVDGNLSIRRNIIEVSGTSNAKTGINTGPTNLTAGNRGVIANNFISAEGTSSCYAIFLGSTSSYIDVIYNNMYTNGTNASSSRTFYMNGASNIRLYNNNLIAGGAGYAMYILSPTTGLVESDYNNFITGNTEFIYRSGNQADLATWQGVSGYDANSVSIDPQYTSTTSPMDLHISEASLAGAGITFGGITEDIDGDTRPNPPTIGADEDNGTGCGTLIIWTGTIDTDWHKAGNWGCSQVPDKTTEVFIPSAPVNQPEIKTTFTGFCRKLDMESGSSLIVRSNAELYVKIP